METKHTPGKWTNKNGSILTKWETGEEITVALTGVTKFCGDEAGGPKDTRMKAEDKANACLIAAAPDLLAVCKRLAEIFPESDMDVMDAADFVDRSHRIFAAAEQAKAAIAKAKGE